MLSEGTAAPVFSLPNQDGDTVELEELRGQWVVLYFYPRADTPGCTKEACGFRDVWTAYEDAGARVLGVSDDPVDDLLKFAEKYDLPFELLSDESGDVSATYESYGEKNVFGNVVEGVFRNTYLIDPEGTIAEVYGNVSPEGHAEAVLEDIEGHRS